MSGRRNPFDEIEELFDRMSRNFNDMGQQFQGGATSSAGGASGMNVDVAERDDEYVVTADLPGYENDEIDVTVEGRRLTIRTDRSRQTESNESDRYLRQERHREQMSRTVTLPGEIAEDRTSATHRNGVLTVTLPKRQSGATGSQIDIE